MSDTPYFGDGDMRISMEQINDKDIESKLRALEHPLWLPPEFKFWLGDFALRVATDFYSKQIEGIRATRFRAAENRVDQSTLVTHGVFYSPASDGNGPRLTGLQNGLWMFIVGCDPGVDGFQHDCNTVVNDVYPDDPIQDEQTLSGSSGGITGIVINDISPTAYVSFHRFYSAEAKAAGLANSPVRPTAKNNNTVELQYYAPVGSGGLERRHLTGVLIQDLSDLNVGAI